MDVQSKVDACWLALAVMVMPASSYLAIHSAVLNHVLHFWSLLILGCAPVAFLAAAPDGLWWLPMSPRFIKGLSRLLLILAAFGLLAGGRTGALNTAGACAPSAWLQDMMVCSWPNTTL